MNTLRVWELIKLLEAVPKEYQDSEVTLEGCDCWNRAISVSILPNTGLKSEILIRCNTLPVSSRPGGEIRIVGPGV